MSALDQLFQDYHTASWMAVGLLLVLVEILLMPGFFLSYALAAFLMALLSVVLDHGASLLSESMVFLLIGTLLLLPARWLVKRSQTQVPDINQY
jgi:membrane protein implicated in regulation of membrane protease activity